jgi:hypothetical protein
MDNYRTCCKPGNEDAFKKHLWNTMDVEVYAKPYFAACVHLRDLLRNLLDQQETTPGVLRDSSDGIHALFLVHAAKGMTVHSLMNVPQIQMGLVEKGLDDEDAAELSFRGQPVTDIPDGLTELTTHWLLFQLDVPMGMGDHSWSLQTSMKALKLCGDLWKGIVMKMFNPTTPLTTAFTEAAAEITEISPNPPNDFLTTNEDMFRIRFELLHGSQEYTWYEKWPAMPALTHIYMIHHFEATETDTAGKPPGNDEGQDHGGDFDGWAPVLP